MVKGASASLVAERALSQAMVLSDSNRLLESSHGWCVHFFQRQNYVKISSEVTRRVSR
jgi:hypothetical protein